MKNTDQRVLAAAVDALASGRGGWLLTIAATFGASPRPLGALAFLDNHGQFTGSLSGGCIEDDLLEKLADGSLAAEHCTLQEYGVTPEENERFGLPCGGRMKVLIEPVAASHLAHMKELLLALNARECRRRCVDLNSGEWLLSAPDRVCPLTLTEEMLQQDVVVVVRRCIEHTATH